VGSTSPPTCHDMGPLFRPRPYLAHSCYTNSAYAGHSDLPYLPIAGPYRIRMRPKREAEESSSSSLSERTLTPQWRSCHTGGHRAGTPGRAAPWSVRIAESPNRAVHPRRSAFSVLGFIDLLGPADLNRPAAGAAVRIGSAPRLSSIWLRGSWRIPAR
jgi:hypothetical protein